MASEPTPIGDAGAVLEMRRVSRYFGGLAAVKNLDLSVMHGQIHGLIGPNGAGKTTLFNVITGANTASSGAVLVDGRDITHLPPHAINHLGVARTFQNIRLFKEISVYENVRTAATWRGGYGWLHGFIQGLTFERREAAIHDQVLQLLEDFQLGHRAREVSRSLPYGEQRRLEIVRALATRPKLLLLDEPAAGLNAAETDELMALVHRILEQYDLTILLIEHDMRLVMEICQAITVLDHGEKICEGDADQVRNDPQVIEAYLGQGDMVDASDQ
ncbi:MAG: ATP-binding cassette domain-containing protein [Armatimonadia bacterium]|nr:ATP-binding cassette domain-containing protein [Armatimonadia bacterium]